MTNPPLYETAEAHKRILEMALRMYQSRDQRAAMRGALSDAAAICDTIAKEIEKSNTTRGRLTKIGRALSSIAQACGDAIWAMREKIEVPDE